MQRSLPRKAIWIAAFFFCINAPSCLGQVNDQATEKTKNLYSNLKRIQSSNAFMFGQEFFNSFRFSSGSVQSDETYSDSKAVTGSHPAVLGSDFHYYLEKSESEATSHLEGVKYAYAQGYVITFDWHLSARGTTSYQYAESVKDLVNNIVGDIGDDRDWYLGELDKAIDIINNDLVVDGEKIPIVFRPLHEMNGGWFWWGSAATTPANYKALYQLTVDYFKANTTNVLFCWSPNTPFSATYYPGDDYVDVVGVDAYEVTQASLRTELGAVVDFATQHEKVPVFTETGNRTDVGDDAAVYWNNIVLPGILDDPSDKSKRIAWVLTWINASWSKPYVPQVTSSNLAKESFIAFKNSPNVLFGDEISGMYEPYVPLGEQGALAQADDLQVYPVPANKFLTVKLHGFALPARIGIYDATGALVSETFVRNSETTVDLKDALPASGMYLLRATDNRKTLSRKIVVN